MGKILKNKKILIISILLIIIIALVPLAYALFSDVENMEKELKVGEVRVELHEDKEWEENEDEFGIKKYTKAVKGVSVAKDDAYVRIKCIPVVEHYVESADRWNVIPVPQEDIVVAINSDNWVQDGEYWYYKNIVKGFEETDIINIDWSIIELPVGVEESQIRTDVRVILEYAQATNEMWKSIFQIEDLPAGVERVQE